MTFQRTFFSVVWIKLNSGGKIHIYAPLFRRVNRSVGKRDAAKICIMLELFIQTPGMTALSIWTFCNANKGGGLNMLLPASLKKSFFRIRE